VLIGALAFAACSDDDDNVVQPDPCTHCVVSIDPSKDNTLYQDEGDVSNGLGEGIFAGVTVPGGRVMAPPLVRRALIAFDMRRSGIPGGSTIDSVFLDLTVTKTRVGISARTFALYPVTRDWGEGASRPVDEGGGGTTATADDATWLHTFYDNEFWANPGGDFFDTADASAEANHEDVRYRWGSTPRMTATVQSWLDNPSNNFGWILIGEETVSGTTKRFGSRENQNISARPALQIYYTKL